MCLEISTTVISATMQLIPPANTVTAFSDIAAIRGMAVIAEHQTSYSQSKDSPINSIWISKPENYTLLSRMMLPDLVLMALSLISLMRFPRLR
jgi:hypothetical protein